ncbi:MAG: hypothetical protein LT071_03420 [Nocardioides sp.]|nr:hypothetical protein [Nocardioides sp.]
MGDRWLPWSAASLASGAVLAVLASFALPLSLDAGDLLWSVHEEGSLWLVGAAALFLASIGLTFGLPTIQWLLPSRNAVVGMVGLGIWGVGTISLAGLSMLLVAFRAAVHRLGMGHADVELVSRDAGVTAAMTTFLIGFYLGELISALVLLRGGQVGRWVPLLMLVHIGLVPVTSLLPTQLQGLQAIAMGVALMGVAVKATEIWAHDQVLGQRRT